MDGPPTFTASDVSPSSRFQLPHLRWFICALLFAACTINYINRQTVAVLKPHLQDQLHWTESDYGWMVFAFQVAYALMMMVSGHLIDRVGTKLGYAIAMAWWSLAAMGHALARSAFSFGVARFLLGAGEAGNFPAAIKAVAEWFPPRERALATGIFNAGTNIGAVATPPLVVWLTLRYGWQEAFVVTGALGFVWLVFWLLFYRLPEQHPRITSRELEHIRSGELHPASENAPKLPWQKILAYRQAWGFILGKGMTDPIWWFYIFWLPSYLTQGRGFTLQEIAYFAWIPFLAADAGSVLGGWLSGFLMKRGWPLSRARKTAMLICAFCMPTGIVAVFAPTAWMALALISIATSAHQGWSANVFTLASDMFPKKDVGLVVGLGGAAGAVGGMVIAPVAGYTLQWFHTYVPLFIITGVMHPLAMGVIHRLIPKIAPVASAEPPR
ncbi:MAG: MFS transporter [Acidobacteriia bacterium]|nr:MFS transporter [Terriglobia bacterium]